MPGHGGGIRPKNLGDQIHKLVAFRLQASAPTQSRGDMGKDRLNDMSVVIDAELVGHGKQQRIGFGDAFVTFQLLDEDVWLCGINATEYSTPVCLDVAEVILALVAAEIRL